MKEQIEEMTEHINDMYGVDAMYYGVDSNGIAHHLYSAGYRKQKEGEWKPIVKCKTSTKTLIYYQCSLCGVYLATQANFCPNCGAKMRGGAE